MNEEKKRAAAMAHHLKELLWCGVVADKAEAEEWAAHDARYGCEELVRVAVVRLGVAK